MVEVDLTRAEQDAVVKRVCERLLSRHEKGMIKFGRSMVEDNRGVLQWIDDAIEEALDFANYLERLKLDIIKLDIRMCDHDGF